jgi:crotonyl-CoA carboxylase/reductase
VIVGATSGFQLDFDVRHLWMRQKRIIGSHFANSYEATRANQLIIEKKIHPVLSQTMPWEGVGEAHQKMYENAHAGKTAILVQAAEAGLGKSG